MGNRKRKLSFKKLPVLRQLQFPTEGEYFDLKTLFDKLNAEYFGNALKGYTITWGRKRKRPPKEYFVFGTIQEEDKMIRIHPLLDAPFVPTWFLEYVVYHEMLHAVVPEEIDEHGRRRVHTREFYRRERKFHCYYRARRWEDENLDRFLADRVGLLEDFNFIQGLNRAHDAVRNLHDLFVAQSHGFDSPPFKG